MIVCVLEGLVEDTVFLISIEREKDIGNKNKMYRIEENNKV